MAHDAVGLEVSGADAAAVDAVDHFRVQLLRMGPDAGDVIAAADANPEVVLLQAYAATFFLYGQTNATQTPAETYLARARLQSRSCHPREELFLRATEAWARGDHEAALDDLEALCRRWPRDLVAAKIAEFHYYCAGQWWTAKRFLRLVEEIAAQNAAEADFLAMRSFAHELGGDRDAALLFADAALALAPATPWAHHSLAHVYLLGGDVETGIRRLSGERPVWRRFNRSIHAHNAWHLALLYLEQLDIDGVLQIHREDIWGHTPDLIGEQVDAIALLWRLDLADRPYDDDWKDIAAHVMQYANECFIPFLNVHFVYALARAGEEQALAAGLASARDFAARQQGERSRAWASTGLPLLEGCAALARGDAAACARILAPILAEVGRVGGSDAQDAVFLETYFVALLRSGQRSEARSYLDTLRGARLHSSALTEHWRTLC